MFKKKNFYSTLEILNKFCIKKKKKKEISLCEPLIIYD